MTVTNQDPTRRPRNRIAAVLGWTLAVVVGIVRLLSPSLLAPHKQRSASRAARTVRHESPDDTAPEPGNAGNTDAAAALEPRSEGRTAEAGVPTAEAAASAEPTSSAPDQTAAP